MQLVKFLLTRGLLVALAMLSLFVFTSCIRAGFSVEPDRDKTIIKDMEAISDLISQKDYRSDGASQGDCKSAQAIHDYPNRPDVQFLIPAWSSILAPYWFAECSGKTISIVEFINLPTTGIEYTASCGSSDIIYYAQMSSNCDQINNCRGFVPGPSGKLVCNPSSSELILGFCTKDNNDITLMK